MSPQRIRFLRITLLTISFGGSVIFFMLISQRQPDFGNTLLCVSIFIVPMFILLAVETWRGRNLIGKDGSISPIDLNDSDAVRPYGDWANEMAITDVEKSKRSSQKI